MLLFVVDGAAWAIPSPDVVVSLFASTAQALGLASVVLARCALGRRTAGPAAERDARGGRRYRRAFQVTLALFVLSLVGWGLTWTHQRDLTIQRLQVNLNRTSVENGKLIGDVNLKTLSYSDQVQREDGLTTDKVADELRAGVLGAVWDVRESEEYEVGAIASARHVRYPDLLADPAKFLVAGEPALLLCFNGNRSSELCDALRPLGYPCRFLIGGYEKWNAESRPLAMRGNHARKDLREIPDYPNKDVLLDTPDVHRLVEKESAVFVDLRYPGEYEGLGHLPGAINLPFRSLVTPELERQLAALPRRPIIAVCYDKRSSFYGLIFGCRLARMGYDYRGRYTVPEEYYVPSGSKEYVQRWEEANAPRSLLTIAAEPLSASLGWLEARIGDLALAIVALAALLRAALLPITWKAERDRRVQRKIAPLVAQTKERLASDPRALSRGIVRLYREHRVRPVLNLVGSCFQLVLFVVFFSVVDSAPALAQSSFLWIDSLAAPDPTYVLPTLLGLAIVAQMALSAARRDVKRALLWLAAGGLLFALAMNLGAGVQLYLCVSLAWIVGHTLVAGWRIERDPARVRERAAARHAASTVVPLEHADRVPGCGNKAARLGALIGARLPVPGGFVLRGASIEAWRTHGGWSDADRAAIARAHRALGAERVAVRSSGMNEDGAGASYAGVFESVLDVERDGLEAALTQVASSLASSRSRAYAGRDVEEGGIVVQAMVAATYAGVLFTEHPEESGSMLVELVAGLGESLVSGRAAPQSFRLGRHGGRELDGARAPIDLAPLIELGRRVEALFGRPQDIEWAFDGTRFWLLQARDITRLARTATGTRARRERERARLLALCADEQPDEPVLVQTELTELLPSPTPFSLAFMDSLWAWGGSTDFACRRLGVPYEVEPDAPPYVVGAFGALYVHDGERRRRSRRGPGAIASFRLSRAADELERSFREDFLPGFVRTARLREALDLERLSMDELLDLYAEVRKSFVAETYVEAEVVNVAADFYFQAAVRELSRRGLDPADVLSHLPPTTIHVAMRLLGEVGAGRAPIQEFLDLFGHRAPLDYELAEPRYREDPASALAMAARAAPPPASTRAGHPAPSVHGRVLATSVERARRFAALKEEAKHHALRELAFLRAILVELGARLRLGRGIFYLVPDEIERLRDGAFRELGARELVHEREEDEQALSGTSLPAALTPSLLERMDASGTSAIVVPQGTARLAGTRVSGAGDVCGRVRVLAEADEIESFRRGEILVARFTDPTWTPAFPLARGIVTEIGGWLSHAAIQAREYGVTAVVGVSGAMSSLRTGDLVRLNGDGTVDVLEERRREPRRPADVDVVLRRGGVGQRGRLADLSDHGARLLLPGDHLAIGELVELELGGGGIPWRGFVARNGTPHEYGLAIGEASGRD